MAYIIDVTGERFSMLEVLEKVKSSDKGFAQFLCKCDCGTEFVAIGRDLRKGKTRSCGCIEVTEEIKEYKPNLLDSSEKMLADFIKAYGL